MTDRGQREGLVSISVAIGEIACLLDSKYSEGVPSVSETLRREIVLSPKSRYQIAREAEVAQSQLSRFLSGETGLTSGTLDRLAAALGLELVSKTVTKRKLRRRA